MQLNPRNQVLIDADYPPLLNMCCTTKVQINRLEKLLHHNAIKECVVFERVNWRASVNLHV